VELVLTTGGGNLESRIDPRVKVSHLRDRASGVRFSKEKNPLKKLGLIATDLLPYAFSRVQQSLRSRRFRKGNYDAAIVSLHGLSASFCCDVVDAKRRIQWIRNDLSLCDPDGKAGRNIREYSDRIDAYACVSGSSHRSLVTLFPEVKERAFVLYNVLDTETMRASAEGVPNPLEKYGPGLKVITVCRLADKAKGLFRMLAVHRRHLAEGLSYKWFVVGDGPDRQALADAVKEAGVEDSFILLGHQSNPFPYYKHADISATLSYYEGLCGAVNEAKVMGKPIIATKFSGIEEQITTGLNGMIVENSEEAIYEGLKTLVVDEELRKSLSNTVLPQPIADDEYKLELLTKMVMGTGTGA
jgi:glycosyltransferase involved in cell wall biosynthesis